MDIFDQTQALELDFPFDVPVSHTSKQLAGILNVLGSCEFPKTSFPVYTGENIIGRSIDRCQIHIPVKVLSKRHAVIEIENDTHMIYDAGSHNKSYKGKLCLKPQVRYELQDGESLTFGNIVCKYTKSTSEVGNSECSTSDATTESFPARSNNDDHCVEESGVKKPLRSETSPESVSRVTDNGVAITVDTNKELVTPDKKHSFEGDIDHFELKSDSELELSDNDEVIPSSQPQVGNDGRALVPETPAALSKTPDKNRLSLNASLQRSCLVHVSESDSDTDIEIDRTTVENKMTSKTCSETLIISHGDSSDSDRDIAKASDKFINFQDEPTQRYPSNNMYYKNKESLDSNDHSANGNAADNGDIDWYSIETQKYVKTDDNAVSKDEAKLKEKAQFKEPSVKDHVPAVANIAMAETIPIEDECEFHLDPPDLSRKTSDKCGNLDFTSQCSDDEMHAAQNRVKEVLCSPALALSPQGLTLHERPSRPVYRSEPSSTVKVSKKQAVLFGKNCIISDDESEDDVPLPCITNQKKTPEISSVDNATEAVLENGKDSEQSGRDVVPVPKIPVRQNRIKNSVVGNTAEDGSTETVGDKKGGRRGKSKRKEPTPSAVEKVVRSPAKKARKISAKDADQNRLPGPVECNLLLSSSPKTYSRKGQPGKSSSEDFEVGVEKMLNKSKRGADLMTSSNERRGLGKRSCRGKGNLAEDQESVMEDTDALSRRQSKRKASDESTVRKESDKIIVRPSPTVTRRSGRSRKATPCNDSDVSSCETPISRVGVGSASSDQMNPAATLRRTPVKIPSIPNSPWTKVGSRWTVMIDEVNLTEKASESREPIKRGRRKVEPVQDVDADVHVDSPPMKTVKCSKGDASALKMGGSPASEKQNNAGRSLTRNTLKKRLVEKPLADGVSDISQDAADVEECVQSASGSSCSKRAKRKNLAVSSDALEGVNAKSKRTTRAASQDRNGGDATNVRKGMDTVKPSASPKARSSRGRTPRRGVEDSPVGVDVCHGKIVSPRKTATSNANSRTGSLSSAEGDTVSKPKIMFTGLSNAKGEKIIKNLGGELVESVFDCTHLVTDKIRRTCKLLCIVARGQPVVSVDWLYRCQEAKRFLDSSPFIIKDTSAEAQFHFGLVETLEKASKNRLLEGFRVHVTSSVKPDPDQMQPIIECAGGEFLQKMPRRITDDDSTTVVVSCVEDLKSCSAALKAGIPIVSSEFILTGVLQQEVDIEANRLDEKAKDVVSPVDKKVPIGKRGLQKSPKSPDPLKSPVEPSPSPRRGGRKRGSVVPMQAEEEDDSGKKQKVATRKKGRDNINLESDDESKAVAMKPKENSRRRRSKQRN